MEGDVWLSENGNSITGFQSTPSVWRETDTIIPIYLDGSISIHSLRMEGD